MKKLPLWLESLCYALGVLIYISVVAWIMQNGEQLFGRINNILGPILFLLLFVISALITSSLALGRPAYLYFNGQNRAGTKMFFYNTGWLIILLFAVILVFV